MSTDKYAAFISGQQRNLSVSGTNAVNLNESKDENDDGWYAHKEMNGDKAISKEDWKKGKRPKLKKEEVEELDEKERSELYIGSVDRDDKDYDAKVKDMRSKANKGGSRVRGRLGKDNANAPMYRKGGALHRSSSQDIKPEHSKRVDVYSKKSKANEETEALDELSRGKLAAYVKKAGGANLGSVGDLMYQAANADPLAKDNRRVDLFKTAGKRAKGVERAANRLAKEEVDQVDEVLDTPGKRLKYYGKAAVSGIKASIKGDNKTLIKRTKGAEMAGRKTQAHIEKSKNDADNNETARKILKDMGRKTGYGAHYDKIFKKEEVENLDEWGTKSAIKGTHARKAPAVTPGKIRFKGRPTKPKAQTDLGLRQEDYQMTTEEVQYMEEMLGKGKINDVADYHMRNYKHHERMMDHHNKMVDHSERVGDKEGVEHHLHKAMGHSYDAEQHEAKLNHALKLKTQLKAHRAMQQAKSDLNRAHLAVARARDEKRDGI